MSGFDPFTLHTYMMSSHRAVRGTRAGGLIMVDDYVPSRFPDVARGWNALVAKGLINGV